MNPSLNIILFHYDNMFFCFVSSGHVITMECLEKLIKKDWLHPLTGEKLTENDIIPLQRVGVIIYFIVKLLNICLYFTVLIFIRVERGMPQRT